MLAHRLRRRPNIKTTLVQRLVFAGITEIDIREPMRDSYFVCQLQISIGVVTQNLTRDTAINN